MPAAATKRALALAQRDMVHVATRGGALFHDLLGKKNNVYVLLRAAPATSAVAKAAPALLDVLELAGISKVSAKIFGVILFFMLVRWSWPRFRFDQLMNLAWKVMLPLGLANLVTVAAVEEFRPQLVAALGAGAAKATALAIPWAVFFLGWIAAGVLTPSGTDNSPIRTPGPLDAEHVLGSRPHDLVEA
jgi:hypothetical protein